MLKKSVLNFLTCVVSLSYIFANLHAFAKQNSLKDRQLIVVAVDGTDSRWLSKDLTPYLHSLRQEGASTLSMENIVPTITAPNFTSSLTGTLPETHGVYTNEWRPGDSLIPPSVFDLFNENPEKVLIVSDDWDFYEEAFATAPKPLFPHITQKRTGEENDDYLKNAWVTLRRAGERLETDPGVQLLFIYLQHVDHIGHTTGWGSADYKSALTRTDFHLKTFMAGLKPQKNRYVMLITDHGGKDFHHENGDHDPNIRNIPFILTGPDVRAGFKIEGARTTQIAPTVALIFGKAAPEIWEEAPLWGVFSGNK